MVGCRRSIQLSTALSIGLACAATGPTQGQSRPPGQLRGPGGPPANTIHDVFEKLSHCWKPPPASAATPMDITVRFSFKRDGEILGKPRITYESATATDNDRLAYRVAVMETLQRCTPMPFTETMAGAIAGRPFAVQFRSYERKAWLLPKTL